MPDIPEPITTLKVQLLAMMRACGVRSARVEYSGSGDDGCIDSVQFEPQTADASMPKTLSDLAEQLAEALINHYHAGFENNDGGSGVIVVKGDSGVIDYERSDYYTESSTEQVEL